MVDLAYDAIQIEIGNVPTNNDWSIKFEFGEISYRIQTKRYKNWNVPVFTADEQGLAVGAPSQIRDLCAMELTYHLDITKSKKQNQTELSIGYISRTWKHV